VTFKVTVFEVVLPFLGVTVTVTLHDPALRPLSDEPDTLQYFAELAINAFSYSTNDQTKPWDTGL